MDVFDQDTHTRLSHKLCILVDRTIILNEKYNKSLLRWRSLKEDGTKMWFRVKFKQVVKIKKISFTNRAEAQFGENYMYLTVIKPVQVTLQVTSISEFTFHRLGNSKSTHLAILYMDQEQNIWETLKRIQLILINFW